LQFVGIVGLTFCLIAALAALRLAKESDSPWPTIFVLGLGALVLAGIVYYGLLSGLSELCAMTLNVLTEAALGI